MARLPPQLTPLWPIAKRLHTRVTRVLGPVNRQVSRLAGGWIPASTVESAAALAPSAAVAMLPVRAPEVLIRVPPLGDPPRHPTLLAQIREPVGPASVVVLPRGRVLGPARAVISRDGTLVGDLSPYFGTRSAREHPVFLRPRAPAPHTVAGSLGVIACRGDMTYYHFIMDVLPRVALLETAAESAAVDRLYVPAQLPFQRDLLTRLGYAPEHCVDSVQWPHVHADRLIVPTLADPDLKTPPWTVAFLRERLLGSGDATGSITRIYVTRGSTRNTRILRNESAVLGVLRRYGFVRVDPGSLSVAEQIELFSGAEVVVAPHGGALTNLAFARPGVSVLELFAPDFVQGCYWKLLQAIPHASYRYLVGSGAEPRWGMSGVGSDIEVDLSRLTRQLELLLADRDERAGAD
jgi:capsular polysaccharide biosynthesis protein